MCPSLTSSSPASIRSVVDLPHPDGPTSTMNSPSPISRSIPGTAGESAPGYQRCAFSKVTLAMCLYLSPPAGTCRTIRCGCDGHYPGHPVSCEVAHKQARARRTYADSGDVVGSLTPASMRAEPVTDG